MRHITHSEVYAACESVIKTLKTTNPGVTELTCYPVPRGGIPAAYALGECGRANGLLINIADTCAEADFVLDDLIDSGKTQGKYWDKYGIPFIALFDKRPELGNISTDEWLIFPWEETSEGSADDIPTRLLQFVGEDPARGGLVETPKRFLKAWQFYTSGYEKNAKEILKTFEDGAEKYDEMVLVKDIPFYSQCEHHLAPFFGVAHIAYIPDGKIVGLSKFSRLVDMYARRLQVQERLTNQVATAIQDVLKPKGVAVVINARHLCMESRGVCQQGHSTTTSAMFGAFKDEHDTRAEFLALIKK